MAARWLSEMLGRRVGLIDSFPSWTIRFKETKGSEATPNREKNRLLLLK